MHIISRLQLIEFLVGIIAIYISLWGIKFIKITESFFMYSKPQKIKINIQAISLILLLYLVSLIINKLTFALIIHFVALPALIVAANAFNCKTEKYCYYMRKISNGVPFNTIPKVKIKYTQNLIIMILALSTLYLVIFFILNMNLKNFINTQNFRNFLVYFVMHFIEIIIGYIFIRVFIDKMKIQ